MANANPTNKFPTIESIGLEAHLKNLHLDYQLYDELMKLELKPSAIAVALSKRSGKAVTASTVRNWEKYYTNKKENTK